MTLLRVHPDKHARDVDHVRTLATQVFQVLRFFGLVGVLSVVRIIRNNGFSKNSKTVFMASFYFKNCIQALGGAYDRYLRKKKKREEKEGAEK